MDLKLDKLESIKAEIVAPPSKSLTHRAIFVSSLADGISTLKNCLFSDDTNFSINACLAFGPKIKKINDNLEIIGKNPPLDTPKSEIYIGNSGTTMRFLSSYSALMRNNQVKITGNNRMNQRPIGDLIRALKNLGVKIFSLENNDCPPLIIGGGGIKGGKTEIRVEKSSQFLSSLLISCVKANSDVEIIVNGIIKSKPYIDLTLEVVKFFGGDILNQDYKKFMIPGNQEYKPKNFEIEGDFSSASYFFAIAAILGGKIKIRNLNFNSSQGDKEFLNILKRMGCKIHTGDNWIEVIGNELNGISIDMKDYPDLVPPLAVLGAFAKGKTQIYNIEHLKYKETDRINALTTELGKIGAIVKELPDGLEVKKGIIKETQINTYNDHRIAMSFAIAALKTGKILIKNTNCVSKSFPNFFNLIKKLKQD